MNINTLDMPSEVRTSEVWESEGCWKPISINMPPKKIAPHKLIARGDANRRYRSIITGPIAPFIGAILSLLSSFWFFAEGNPFGGFAAVLFTCAFALLAVLNFMIPDTQIKLR